MNKKEKSTKKRKVIIKKLLKNWDYGLEPHLINLKIVKDKKELKNLIND